MNTVDVFRILVFSSAALYLLYDFRQKRERADERTQLIHLKSMEVVQKVMSLAILTMAVLYFFYVSMDAVYVLATMSIALFVAYPASHFYYRQRM